MYKKLFLIFFLFFQPLKISSSIPVGSCLKNSKLIIKSPVKSVAIGIIKLILYLTTSAVVIGFIIYEWYFKNKLFIKVGSLIYNPMFPRIGPCLVETILLNNFFNPIIYTVLSTPKDNMYNAPDYSKYQRCKINNTQYTWKHYVPKKISDWKAINHNTKVIFLQNNTYQMGLMIYDDFFLTSDEKQIQPFLHPSDNKPVRTELIHKDNILMLPNN